MKYICIVLFQVFKDFHATKGPARPSYYVPARLVKVRLEARLVGCPGSTTCRPGSSTSGRPGSSTSGRPGSSTSGRPGSSISLHTSRAGT